MARLIQTLISAGFECVGMWTLIGVHLKEEPTGLLGLIKTYTTYSISPEQFQSATEVLNIYNRDLNEIAIGGGLILLGLGIRYADKPIKKVYEKSKGIVSRLNSHKKITSSDYK